MSSLKKIFPLLSVAVLIWLGRGVVDEYLYMHPYYTQMLSNRTNIRLILLGLLLAMVPVGYILFAKKKHLGITVGLIALMNIIFASIYMLSKGGVGGTITLAVRYLFLMVLACYFLVGIETLGHMIKDRILKLSTQRITDVILNLALGLVVFLLVVYVLVLTNVLYTLVSRLVLVALGVLIWWRRVLARQSLTLIHAWLDNLTVPFHHVWYLLIAVVGLLYIGLAMVFAPAVTDAAGSTSPGYMTAGTLVIGALGLISLVGWIRGIMHTGSRGRGYFRRYGWSLVLGVVLLLVVRYLFHGMQLAYLPYPTARDANHAYMFYPKMWALHNGYYRSEPAMSYSMPLWMMYITYFFSLFGAGSFLGISSDTVAIQMNFRSAFLVLLFGAGLLQEFVKFLQKNIQLRASHSLWLVLLGVFLLLQWLYSGMGAFLVFIDNKTDMGILSLIIMAMYSGFVFINKVAYQEHEDADDSEHEARHVAIYGILSGVFFACATLAKPTALFDVVNFSVLLSGVWFSIVGGLGIILLAMGVLTMMNFRGIKQYIPQSRGLFIALGGVIGVGYDFFRAALRTSWKYGKYMLVWGGALVATIVIVKLPFVVIDMIRYDRTHTPSTFIQKIFLSKATSTHKKATGPLLAQATSTALGQTCTLQTAGVDSVDDLYTSTEDVPGSTYNEDVGRYVGFGRKGNATTDARRKVTPFYNPRWAGWLDEGCYGLNIFSPTLAADATLLCEYEQALETADKVQLTQLRQKLSDSDVSMYDGSPITTYLDKLLQGLTTGSSQEVIAEYAPTINSLRAFMQENTLKKTKDEHGTRVYVPYKYLAPWNITHNWSLQNLSSYYTDIGIVRLLLYIFAFVGLVYGLLIRKKKLIVMSVVTLFARTLWWIIGGGILWYGIGVIVWSILAFLAYIDTLLDDDESRLGGYILLICFGVLALLQMVLNMGRIASQGASGPFIWYKSGVGIENKIGPTGAAVSEKDYNFTQEDIFMLQFPHYKRFIELADERAADEGALIAGTYVRYFVNKQHHIKYDQFLTRLWKMFSDDDVCKSYLRLQDQHIRYIVIDPNIGTVVQGAGNQSLFNRFFARVDTTGQKIVEDGVMTMLAKLYDAGYIRYVSSNNLGSKYAFTLPAESFAGATGDVLPLTRARMSIARFFNNQALLSSIVQVAEQRVQDGMFMEDLADLAGVQVNMQTLLGLIKQGQIQPAEIAVLTADEKKILAQYLPLRQLSATNPDAFKQQLSTLVARSIGSQNQIIVLEVTGI